MNNFGHSDSRKMETPGSIIRNNENSHDNQESAQRLQSPSGFSQPIKAAEEKGKGCSENHNSRTMKNTTRGKH